MVSSRIVITNEALVAEAIRHPLPLPFLFFLVDEDKLN